MNRSLAACFRFAAVALIVALAGFGLGGPQRAQAVQPASHVPVGSPAPGFSLTTLDGRQLRLGDYRGQPLILNFFASWCAPCRAEAPRVRHMAAQAKAKGYGVLGIAIRDARGPLSQFMRDAGLKFPAALDVASKVSRAYWVVGPPVTVFIGSDGIIRYKAVGPLSAVDVRKGLLSISTKNG